MTITAETQIDRVRKLALALPGASEKLNCGIKHAGTVTPI
jgi:hypothetical protein